MCDTVPQPRCPARELLHLLAAGHTDAAIARATGTSVRTVQRRVAELEAKLGARSRFQLGVEAVRRGLLDEPAPVE